MAKKKEEVIINSMEQSDDNYLETFKRGKNGLEDMRFFLEFLKKDSQWLELSLAGISTEVISGGPLLLASYKSSNNFIEGTTDEAICSTIDNGESGGNPGSQFLIRTGELERGKQVSMLLSDTGLSSLIVRFGGQCPAINKMSKVNQKKLLDLCLTVAGDKHTKCLVRYGKARAFMGLSTYAVLDQSEMFNDLVAALDKDFKSFEFMGGEYTHNKTTAKFKLEGSKLGALMRNYQTALKSLKVGNMEDFRLVIRFVTSDIGDNAAYVDVMLESTKTSMSILLGSPFRIVHTAKVTTLDFKKQLPYIAAKSKELVDSLEALITNKVKYPLNAMVGLGKYCELSKLATMAAIEEFKVMFPDEEDLKEVTQHDVFFVLQSALGTMREKGFATATIEKCEENLSRLLIPTFPWAEYDIPVMPEW